MKANEILGQMTHFLDELKTIDFGYPLGDNSIRVVKRTDQFMATLSQGGVCAVKWLHDLYSVCDGLNLPDIHVGYFLKPLNRVVAFERSSEPDTVLLDCEIHVLPIGSTGGGLFVVDCDKGCVLLLSPGLLVNGRYDGRNSKVTVIATSVIHFLELLLGDLKAFVNDDSSHTYLAM